MTLTPRFLDSLEAKAQAHRDMGENVPVSATTLLRLVKAARNAGAAHAAQEWRETARQMIACSDSKVREVMFYRTVEELGGGA
jgi:hypothetical protein